MSSQNPSDPSRAQPDKVPIAANNKVIVLSMKNMPSFKFDPTKGFLAANPTTEGTPHLFNLKTQSPQSTTAQQPKFTTTKVGTPGTILIRAPVAAATSQNQFSSFANHPNVKIQENETSPRKVIAVRSNPNHIPSSLLLSQESPVLITANKPATVGAAQAIPKFTGLKAPAGTIMLSQSTSIKSSGNVGPIQIASGMKGITITSSPASGPTFPRSTTDNAMKPSTVRVQAKPVLIRPKVDTPRLVDHQLLTPGTKFQLVSQTTATLAPITQYKTTAALNYHFTQPTLTKTYSAPVPALTLIQPKPQQVQQVVNDCPIEDKPVDFRSTEEQLIEIIRIIEGDNKEPSETADGQDPVEDIMELEEEQNEAEENEVTESSSLLCDETITEVSPNTREASKFVEVTPEKVDDKTDGSSAAAFKKNLNYVFSMDCDKENVDLIMEEDESVEDDEESSMESKRQQMQDYEEFVARSEITKSLSGETTPALGISSKPKRVRKPKNPTIISTLGLPFKPSQPTQKKSKVEKKLEFELDFHDPLNKIQWEDGIGGLNNCNKLFGFDEFGLIEVLNRKDAIAKLNQLDVKDQFTGGSYKLRKITDPADRFTCTVCTKVGTIRDFYSPECCSESCLAITKRKSNETGSSVGKESSSESGLTTPVDERKLIFGGEAIPLQQLQQHLLEKQLPASKRKLAKKQTSHVSPVEQKFQWDTYLSKKSIPAPLPLFKNPYPSSDNPFKVGMKLEAIDPQNQKMICVCTIEEKLGYRIKLHFDGYPSSFDFWVNADSPNIFPAGYCHSKNRPLQTPPKWSNKKFDWSEYLDSTNSIGAQRGLFAHLTAISWNDDNSFEIGMKLETTRDGKIYAASIIDKIGDRILISHDGHEDLPCVWLDIRSPYLHPCNYHKTVDDPECFIPPCRPFEWRNYLASASAKEAPAKILFFGKRSPKEFEPGSKLEIVDCVNRQLIRPATVLCRKDYKIQVIFDGFNISFAYWVDDDCDDIHPINWCEKTNHPIEHPAGFSKSDNKLCPSPGCRGIGNASHRDRYFHDNVEDCPCDIRNWVKLVNIKLGSHLDFKTVGKRGRPALRKNPPLKSAREGKPNIVDDIIDFEDEIPSKTVKVSQDKLVKCTGGKRRTRKSSVKPSEELPEEKVAKVSLGCDFLNDYGPQVDYAFKLWKKNSKVLDRAAIDGHFTGNPIDWNVANVCSFVRRIVEDSKTVDKFREQEIDGEAFVSMCQADLVDLMDMKLGAAVKIYNRILHLRQEIMLKFLKV